MPRALVSVVVFGALVVGGCGVTATRPLSGAAVFASSCAVCHSLIGNESLHRPGGDLLSYRLSLRAMTEFAREMPVRHRLTAAQLGAVVTYVERVERMGRG